VDGASYEPAASQDGPERALAPIYREPARARDAFGRAVHAEGIERATRTLAERPHTFGELAPAFLRADSGERAARIQEVVRWAREVLRADAAATYAPSLAPAREAAADALTRAARELERARNAERALPGRARLGRVLGHALAQLEPHTARELRRLLTAPQRALAHKLRETVRDAVLGRDRELER
jgi:hypothetical protein